MDLGLAGKNVVVTGGSRGIGRSIALEFAAEGANLAICARGEEALVKTGNELRDTGVNVHAGLCDVADRDALTRFLENAKNALAGIDVLVNNTSGLGLTDDEAGWEASWSVDMMASVRASWKVVPWMEQSGGGAIIHISSTWQSHYIARISRETAAQIINQKCR